MHDPSGLLILAAFPLLGYLWLLLFARDWVWRG
jgi:hypothetical protein